MRILPMKLAVKKSRKRATIKFIIVLTILLIVLNLPIVSNKVRNYTYLFFSPFQSGFWKAGSFVSNFLSGIKNSSQLSQENELLKSKINNLIIQGAKNFELEKENQSLRQALKMQDERDFKLIFANIISKEIDKDIIILDRGKKESIIKDLPVITEEGVLIGKVEEVYDDFSRVSLISEKSTVFNVRIWREEEGFNDDIQGVINGLGGLKLELKLIPKEKDIRDSDVVLTSALGGIFPEGLLVGKTRDLQKVDIEPFWRIKVEPAFNITNSGRVFLIE